MLFADSLKKNMTLTRTENSAVAHSTTGSNVLDFFSAGGALRSRDDNDVINLFNSAWAEDRLLTLKAMFYFRDIRGGQGQRNAFRVQLRNLANIYPDAVRCNLHLVPLYGRWDDLYAVFGTSVEKYAIGLFLSQLNSDLEAIENNGQPSLLGKWLKSENTTSKKSRKLAHKTRTGFGMDSKTYRQTLSKLRRAARVVEVAMSAKVYDAIEYTKVPSQAMLRYRNAFQRNDGERFTQYIDDVKTGRAKINADTLYPQQIIHEISQGNIDSNIADSLWNSMPDFTDGTTENAIAVVDVSGSMSGTPMEVAIGLGMYLADRAKGPYANKFITFSESPQMIEIKGKNIVDKVNGIRQANWDMNTNIEAVMEQILQTAIDNNCTSDEMVERLYIISDMEFDSAVDAGYSEQDVPAHDEVLFRQLNERFEESGYKMPNIVFWNVDSRNNNFPMSMDERGFLNVSGYSPSIFKNLVNNTIVSPIEFMMEILNAERYRQIEI
jgi:hypothetical protein